MLRSGTMMDVAPRRPAWPLATVGAALVAAMVAGIFALRHPTTPVATSAPASAAPASARVHIDTMPPGALIEWNGRPLDRTPADLTLEPGSQTLVLSRDGFETEIFTVNLKAGDTLTRAIDLRAKPTPPAPPAPQQAAATPVARPAGPPQRSWSSRERAVAAPPPQPVVQTPAPAPAPTPTVKPKIKVLDDNDPTL
jgi:hypothetical protein